MSDAFQVDSSQLVLAEALDSTVCDYDVADGNAQAAIKAAGGVG